MIVSILIGIAVLFIILVLLYRYRQTAHVQYILNYVPVAVRINPFDNSDAALSLDPSQDGYYNQSTIGGTGPTSISPVAPAETVQMPSGNFIVTPTGMSLETAGSGQGLTAVNSSSGSVAPAQTLQSTEIMPYVEPVKTVSQVAPPVQTDALPTVRATYLGCYKDAQIRALPTMAPTPMTVFECKNAANAAGSAYFGMQFANGSPAGKAQCWYGPGMYGRYGEINACTMSDVKGRPLGTSYANAVYEIVKN